MLQVSGVHLEQVGETVHISRAPGTEERPITLLAVTTCPSSCTTPTAFTVSNPTTISTVVPAPAENRLV
jgi:hypothetical protein